jgi:hypothetical protein
MRKILFALLSLATVSSAHAQVVELYGTLGVDRIANNRDFFDSSQLTNYTSAGATLGGTINFLPLHVLNVGFDFRDTISAQNTWLAGLQIKAKPPLLRFHPYFKVSVGETHINITNPYNSTGAKFDNGSYIYNAALGVDYRFKPFIDLRLIEIGDGRTLGAGSTNPENILTINAGIVFHIP